MSNSISLPVNVRTLRCRVSEVPSIYVEFAGVLDVHGCGETFWELADGNGIEA